jgi:rSAM/selenodomain-associated transferase 1
MTDSELGGTVLLLQLVVLAKEPLPGAAKTRLCPPLTLAEAASVARLALAGTLSEVVQARVAVRTVALEGQPGSWLAPTIGVIPQRPGDLAARLAGAFEDAWARHPLPTLLIGMDTPQVTAADLEQAGLALLNPDTDAVLGRCDDGGYWVIGTKLPVEGLFRGVPMSTPDTADQQLRRMSALGLRVHLLPSRRDVDTFDDALAVAELIPHSAFAAEIRRHSENLVLND